MKEAGKNVEGHRIREQRCLYAIAELFNRAERAEEPALAAALPLIAAGFQFPDDAGVRIRLPGASYATPNFRESASQLAASFCLGPDGTGQLEVAYPAEDRRFLREEQALVGMLAGILGPGITAWRTHGALRESEKNLQEAQRIARFGSWVLDLETDCVDYSAELAAVFGLPRRAARTRWSEQRRFFSRDTWERLQAVMAQTVHTGAPYETDIEVYSPEGSRWLTARGEAVRDATGRVAKLRGTTIDITERKKAELALDHSERRFRSLIENSSDLIVVLDADGLVTYASPSVERIGGYRQGEVVGRRFFDFVHPDDLPAAARCLQRVLLDPAATEAAELRYLAKDGAWRFLASLSKNALADPGIGGIIVNARDVTERRRMEERLRLASAVVESSPTVLYRVDDRDPGRRPLYVSENFRQFGYEAQALVSGEVAFTDLVHPDDRPTLHAAFTQQGARESSDFLLRYRLRTRAGAYRWVEDHVFLQRHDGRLTSHQGLLTDITERKEQEEKIARLARIRAVLSGINNVIVRARDRRELFAKVCRIAVEQGGFAMAWIGEVDPAGEVCVAASHGRGQDYVEWLLRQEAEAPFRDVLAGRRPLIVNDLDREQGATEQAALARGWRSTALLPLLVDDAVAGIFALYSAEAGFFDTEELQLVSEVASDVSFGWDHILKESKVDYLVLYDPLTGLANRELFRERIAQQLAQAGPGVAAVALVDVARFQDVNDSLGWNAGDALLRAAAGRLAARLGETNVARVEGDCFALALPRAADANEVRRVVDDALSACFGMPFETGGAELRLSARCGIAVFPADGRDAATLYKHAGVALKKAAQAEERIVFYAPEMNARVAARVKLESKLHRALEAGEFELYYQPKYHARSGALAGLEALIRWNDPDKGLVSPADFVPVLEQTGLILPAGDWAIAQALRQYSDWRAQGLVVPRIAVNVSAMQLRQRDFVNSVRRLLQRHPGEHGLDLEITESLVMGDIEENMRKLLALREEGVRVAIDDFGTGHSSLAYLSKLPVDTLKIDRTFVVAMPDSPDDLGIISTIIALAHQLKLQVVAEGVDSEEQAKLLRLLKCDQLQGYLFCKPLPASELRQQCLTVGVRAA